MIIQVDFGAIVQVLTVSGILMPILGACVHEPFIDPVSLNGGAAFTPGRRTNGTVCFETSVFPIVQSTCAKRGCHYSSSKKEAIKSWIEGGSLNNLL